MKRTLLITTAAVTLGALSGPLHACNPVPGALIFGGIGAAIGNAPGAAIGAVIGSAITGSAPCPGYYDPRYVYRGHYEPAAQYVPREYVGPPAYYAPAPVYYPPAPVYYAPPVAYYRPYPNYYYAPRYAYARGHYRHNHRRDYWR